MYKIADYVEVLELKDKFQISYRNVLSILKTRENCKVIKNLCGTGVSKESSLVQSDVFKVLLNNHLIHDDNYSVSNNPRTVYYFENQFHNADQRLSLLKERRVCILGLGGIGSLILQYLCGMGIKNYFLIDYDQVEESNLNRQFIYSRNDIGKNKIDICKKYVYEHVLGAVNVETFKGKIYSSDQFQSIVKNFQPSIIVCAADKPQDKILHEAHKVGKELNIPVIGGGVGPDFGNYSFSDHIVKKNKSNPKILHKREVTYGSFGPTNGCVAALMANDIVMTLIDGKRWAEQNNTIAIDFNNLKIYKFGRNNEK